MCPLSYYTFREGIIDMVNRQRKAIIEDIAVDSLLKGCTEAEALSMVFWKLSYLEAPLSNEEQLLLCAFYRIYQSYFNITITSHESAFKVLGISANKLNMSHSRITKEAKLSYWKQFNELSHDLKELLYNAYEIGSKKKALSYICNYKSIMISKFCK